MKRGDVVITALPGDFGKPRPAVIIQSDDFILNHPTVLVCGLTSKVSDDSPFRISIEPTKENGLRERSQIMVDKIATMRREKVKQNVGKVDGATLNLLNESLALFIGIDE